MFERQRARSVIRMTVRWIVRIGLPWGLILFGIITVTAGAWVVALDLYSANLFTRGAASGSQAAEPEIRSGILAAGAVVFGVGVALISLAFQRDLARKQSTIALLNRNVWDEDCIKAVRTFIQLGTHEGEDGRGRPEGLEYWTNPRHRGSEQSRAIAAVLNDYEMMALGIRRGIIDEDFFKSFARSAVISHWNIAASFIEELRRQRGNERLFLEFQGLVEAWGSGDCYEGARPLEKGIARKIYLGGCNPDCPSRR